MSTPAERLARVEAHLEARGDRRVPPRLMLELTDALVDLAATAGGGPVAWATITGKPATFPPDLTAHLAAADPHTSYQQETEKGGANGYAGLDGTGKVPAAQLPASGGGVPTTIATVGGLQTFVQTSDVTNATVTPAVLPGLVFSFVANALYAIDVFMRATSAAATTGYGFDLDVSAAVDYVGLTFQHQLAVAGTLSGGDTIADAAARGLSSGVPAVTVQNMIQGSGQLDTGANAGTCQLRFRPEVAASATCKANSVMRVMRVA